MKEKHIQGNNFKVIKQQFGFEFNPDWIEQIKNESINYNQNYDGVENLIAISDIHGQYNTLVKLLKVHNVIDENYNWIYGNGHLVINGDIMDRGPRVTESLWLIFLLEQQAKQHGGMVHVLLGNHEIMVLGNDLRYIRNKYVKTSKLMNTSYNQLFAKNTFMGEWLRKKSAIVSINDMLFVHAGISPEFIKQGFTIVDANRIFIDNIIGVNEDTIMKDSVLTFMTGEKGPVWFRGYFSNGQLNESQIDSILNHFNKKRIIVGHNSLPNITSFYNGKVLGIDSDIQDGYYGELLIYENGNYYRGTILGNRIKLENN
ncbi:metallophosphoesterase [Bacteroidota bacterium]